MTYKKIMIPYLTRAAGGKAFSAGAALAKEFKSHMDVVHLRQRITPSAPGNIYYPIATTYVQENLEMLMEAADQQANDLQKAAIEQCASLSVEFLEGGAHSDDKGATAIWTDTEGNLPADLGRRARLADLTVLARTTNEIPQPDMDLIEEVIFQSGQPVMVVGGDDVTSFPETIVVAWDGGREAARAMMSALPVLQEADTVIVLSVGDLPWGAETPEAAAALLRLHGVHTLHIHKALGKQEDPQEAFLAQIKQRKAELVVMGAYSHNRWREMVLGGFTRDMLRHCETPLLMAH